MQTKKTKLCTKLERAFKKDFTCKNKKGTVYSVTNKKKECLLLELNDDHLDLAYLKKCPDSSGSATLEKLEKVGKEMGLARIDLHDHQHMKVDCGKKKDLFIFLTYLNILADGESWYNKMGYTSKTHQAEVRNNKRIGQMNAVEFVREVMNFRKKSPYKRMDYWGPLDRTVKEYFTGIKEALKTEQPTHRFLPHECIKYKWLEHLLENVNRMSKSIKSKSKCKIHYDAEHLSLPL